MNTRGQYFIGGVADGQVITLPHNIRAVVRSQFDRTAMGKGVGIELAIEDLVVRVRSGDSESDCSLFAHEGKHYNIQGTGYSLRSDGTFLQYVIGITDPETSPCRGKCMQHDLGMRLD